MTKPYDYSLLPHEDGYDPAMWGKPDQPTDDKATDIREIAELFCAAENADPDRLLRHIDDYASTAQADILNKLMASEAMKKEMPIWNDFGICDKCGYTGIDIDDESSSCFCVRRNELRKDIRATIAQLLAEVKG